MSALTVREAYRLWAATYERETAVSFLENELVAAMSPSLSGRRVLDAGCGIGRRLQDTGAALAVGVDASPEMLAAGAGGALAAADIRALPFTDGSFDVVWCRLVIGHLPATDFAYRELSRVCVAGGSALVTDFHADAAAHGGKRTFRDSRGELHEVEHYIHTTDNHRMTAESAGLALLENRVGVIGPSIRKFYDEAGRGDMYEREKGRPIVSAFLFRRLD